MEAFTPEYDPGREILRFEARYKESTFYLIERCLDSLVSCAHYASLDMTECVSIRALTNQQFKSDMTRSPLVSV